MSFMLLLFALFAVLSLYRPHRFEWGVLSMLWFSLWVNTSIYGHNDTELYVVRSVITTIAGLALVGRWTMLSSLLAVIMFITLLGYAALAFDVSQGRHILIYNYNEAVNYGLVICQIICTYPTLRDSYINYTAGSTSRLEHLQRNSRS